ncbi:chromatin assembly factor 1 subunit A-domain-containing protein [Rhodocollybia butyracea]|uniref:Chromatin assembly factor 1 subunit A-domain-containing protein n=1 Tax=Rhodocollybia butyracea TaxID=206335 RepID=A0A9P5PJZ0_9AGAR|nr:chromatin assembly factor 1 subunit A-domain-containing protein [Rhodocollybia butyracea]
MPTSTTKEASGTAETSQKPSLVELKNGKVTLKQKLHSFEKHSETLQELVKFREMLQEHAAKGGSALTVIDDEHKPLIAKLVHESDKTLVALAKHIHSQLLPTDDDDSDVPSEALLLPSIIETAIKAVAQRTNYGIETDTGVKAPAATCVWRWEIREPYRHWLPKNGQEKAASRMTERIKAKDDLMAIFSALPEGERRSILHIKISTKTLEEDKGKAPVTSAPSQVSGNSQVLDPLQTEGIQEAPEQSKSKVGRPRKDADKTVKAKKEKDAQKSLMSNFFTKTKLNPKSSSSKPSSSNSGSSTSCSDFEKMFKPFVLKKGAQLAPINAFLDRKPSKITTSSNGMRHDVIVIDEDDPVSTAQDVVNVKGRLGQILSTLPPPVAGPLKHPPKSPAYKTYNPVCVRDLLKQLSEVELFGDATSVRKIHNKLADRDLLPAKVLIFHEDSRPGYYGTWTRSSRLIGPRTPYAKDVLEIEYGYDSGEEWEEEPAGDADDVMDDADDEEVTEDRDSDLDDWIVDDDEVEEDTPVKPRSVSPVLPLFPPKRKVEKVEETGPKATKKRKVVVPLVAFAKGPCWEPSIGQNDKAFSPYRIRLLNETSFPIDPFTFVSTMVEDRKPSVTSEKGFAVPALPNRVIKKSDAANSSPTVSATVSTAPKKFTAPKTAFPEEHLPVLLSKINTAQAANLTILVEAVSQELREHKVKKNAIEAKIREVGEKCKVRRFWVVKE